MISRKQLEEMAEAVKGIPVLGCLPGSTAAEAGVRYGDIVLSVNGLLTPSVDEYLEARKLRTDGFELRLFRAGVELTIWVAFRPPTDTMAALAMQVAEGRYVSPEPQRMRDKGLPS
ncbi:MAG TPA: PDZ domain-containing protein [Polyangiaceae bacterium]|nr:PDZ domain-containing protein [Polyangiaceae bacterium]